MRHFIFHIPVLISERTPVMPSDYPGQMEVRDVCRQAFDIHVYAADLDRAKEQFQDALKEICHTEGPPPEVGTPYVGPV